ncbi:MAG TPA: hypothetical protein VFQ83_16530 [Candidatus Udaeobacter sp.]|nr:hypothetical protein [Candidatus Udaeobacter sp.]
MKIHLKQIPARGLHLDGDEDCPIHDIETEGIRCAGRLRYDLDVGIAGDSLWVRGSLSQPVELNCVSCLEKFVHEVQVPEFAAHVELHGPETVDLTPLMREDLLLNLPAHPRCDRDGHCVCKPKPPASVKEDTKRKSDWSALDKLKIENR